MIETSAAIDEIYGLFNTAWEANAAAEVGYTPEIRWLGVEERDVLDPSKYAARASVLLADEDQDGPRGPEMTTAFTIYGIVVIQIFAPRSESDSMTKGQLLAKIAKDAYRGKKTSGGIWFKNCRVKTLEPEEKFRRFNVICDFQFGETM